MLVPVWIVAVGAGINLEWNRDVPQEQWATLRPKFKPRIYMMPPNGSTTRCWYLQSASGITVGEVSRMHVIVMPFVHIFVCTQTLDEREELTCQQVANGLSQDPCPVQLCEFRKPDPPEPFLTHLDTGFDEVSVYIPLSNIFVFVC